MALTWNTSTGSVNTEVTGTFTFKDNDVRGFYVDWDDGDSNKKEDANYQWVQFTEPKSTTDVKHTYNKSGTFYPVVQTFNSRGFVSRFYSANTSEADVTPWTQDTGVASLPILDTVATGVMRTNAKTFKSGIDNSYYESSGPNKLFVAVFPTLTDAELSYFSPIKIEVTAVLDMTLLDGTSAVVGTPAAEGGGGQQIHTLTCVLSGAYLSGTTAMRNVLASGGAAKTALASGAAVSKILKVKYLNPKYMGTSGKTSYTENAALNKLKIGFFTTTEAYGSVEYIPICYITTGDPIKFAEDTERFTTLDFSQSRAAAANVSFDKYYYDNGKGWKSPANMWKVSGAANTTTTADITDAVTTIPVVSTAVYPKSGIISLGSENIIYTGITATSFTGCTRGAFLSGPSARSSGYTVSFGPYKSADSALAGTKWQFVTPSESITQKSVSYTYMVNPQGLTQSSTVNPWTSSAPWTITDAAAWDEDQFLLDDFGRIVDQYHLVRMQGLPSSADSYRNPLNTPSIFRITPGRSWNLTSTSGAASAGAARGNPTKVLDSGTNGSYSLDYTYNNQTNTIPTGAHLGVSLSGMNDGTWYDMSGEERDMPLNEYLILLFDSKTDNIFLDMNNYSPYLQSNITTAIPWGIGGVSVLAVENSGTNTQNIYWKPVEFEDGTVTRREYRDTTNDKYTTINASLTKSGPIKFSTPPEWRSVKLEDLAGGYYDTDTVPTTTGSCDFGILSGTVSAITAGSVYGDYLTVTGTSAGDISGVVTDVTVDDIGSMKYIAIITAPTSYTGNALWVTKDGSNGWNDDTLYLHIGNTGTTLRDSINAIPTTTDIEFVMRRVNMYDTFTGFSKVYLADGGTEGKLLNVDSEYPSAAWPNQYCLYPDNGNGDSIAEAIEQGWYGQDKYAVKITLSGSADLYGNPKNLFPEINNIFDASQGNSSLLKVIDDSAFNLNSLAVTSSINVGRAGQYFKAITRKGKIIITKTGISMQEVGFSSVALGDESSSTAFDDHGPSTLYGHLHTIRRIQAEDCRVFWDEPQKDGTFVRLFGVVQNVNETSGVGGPRRVVQYTFTLVLDGVALFDVNGDMMTDIFPLGGIEDEKSYA